jgi:uncharacterized membrane protein (DUF106 family)
VRKDELANLQEEDKELTKKFKEAACGDTNDDMMKQIAEIKTEIE